MQDDFQFINVSFCLRQLPVFEILVNVYVNILGAVTMVFAFFNMKISSHFGKVGKITAITVLVVITLGWMDVLITLSFNQSDSPHIFLWDYYWCVVYTFSTVLLTSACLYLPLVSF